jgi:hypothetical protein
VTAQRPWPWARVLAHRGGGTLAPENTIGAIRVDPSDPETVWVGTGETWVRNSVSVGDGVYRTKDGGDSWEHLGLEATERIASHTGRPARIARTMRPIASGICLKTLST